MQDLTFGASGTGIPRPAGISDRKKLFSMRNNILNYLTLAVVLLAFPLLVFFYLKSDPALTFYSYIGLTLMCVSLVLFTIARIQLGSSFQVSAKANKLVTNGLYGIVRHPVYYSGIILILGVVIFSRQFFLLFIWAGLIFLQRKRIRNEEKVLEDKFGEEYVKYKKNTWF